MKKNYSELLKDPRWQKKRLEILNRDDWTCQGCLNKEKMLVVHHRKYFYPKKPWEYENELLVTLCQDCHEIWAGDSKILKKLLDDLEVILLQDLTPQFASEIIYMFTMYFYNATSFGNMLMLFDYLIKSEDNQKKIDALITEYHKEKKNGATT